ncbi:hypothetical protein Scep_025850 [Stephania cephalantha]|uniref:Uncharacterized protein n=1 Tax=Stephania cephalantha TaxID=152367 RepID=A0AAP0HRY5_9MAGN
MAFFHVLSSSSTPCAFIALTTSHVFSLNAPLFTVFGSIEVSWVVVVGGSQGLTAPEWTDGASEDPRRQARRHARTTGDARNKMMALTLQGTAPTTASSSEIEVSD